MSLVREKSIIFCNINKMNSVIQIPHKYNDYLVVGVRFKRRRDIVNKWSHIHIPTNKNYPLRYALHVKGRLSIGYVSSRSQVHTIFDVSLFVNAYVMYKLIKRWILLRTKIRITINIYHSDFQMDIVLRLVRKLQSTGCDKFIHSIEVHHEHRSICYTPDVVSLRYDDKREYYVSTISGIQSIQTALLAWLISIKKPLLVLRHAQNFNRFESLRTLSIHAFMFENTNLLPSTLRDLTITYDYRSNKKYYYKILLRDLVNLTSFTLIVKHNYVYKHISGVLDQVINIPSLRMFKLIYGVSRTYDDDVVVYSRNTHFLYIPYNIISSLLSKQLDEVFISGNIVISDIVSPVVQACRKLTISFNIAETLLNRVKGSILVRADELARAMKYIQVNAVTILAVNAEMAEICIR